MAGLAYVVGGVITPHFRNDLLPAKADLRWNRVVGVISEHLRWKRAGSSAAWTYNVVQRLTYLAVVFALFPAILWTGLAMSFGVTSVFPILATALGGHQSARTLHFVFVTFAAAFSDCTHRHALPRRIREQCTRDDNGIHTAGREGSMSKFFTRRTFITGGLATVAGASGVGAAVYFAGRHGLIPPDHAGILGVGKTLTYSTQRLLTSGHTLGREFKRSDISKVAPVNGPHPMDETYRGFSQTVSRAGAYRSRA